MTPITAAIKSYVEAAIDYAISPPGSLERDPLRVARAVKELDDALEKGVLLLSEDEMHRDTRGGL